MKSSRLDRIVLRGYKSIRECDLELRDLNVLVGSNASGKSNFMGFFHMVRQIFEKNLQLHVAKQGGLDALLHFGGKETERIFAELHFGENGYKFSLESTGDCRLVFASEQLWRKTRDGESLTEDLGRGHSETKADGAADRIGDFVTSAASDWRVYHFHDTGDSALLKRMHGINDNLYLRPDAANLAAFLYLLKNQFHSSYERITMTVQQAVPSFGDFILRPHPGNSERIALEWRHRRRDNPFTASALSDGELRFICLATVLLQPKELRPATIIIDEPEIGLSPYALHLLASLTCEAAETSQVIISTQSTDFLDDFSPEDTVVAAREEGHTTIKRLDTKRLKGWFKEYSLGELWYKNILEGELTE